MKNYEMWACTFTWFKPTRNMNLHLLIQTIQPTGGKENRYAEILLVHQMPTNMCVYTSLIAVIIAKSRDFSQCVWMLHIISSSRPAHIRLLMQPLCDPNPYSDLHLTFIEKGIVRCEATRLSCNIQIWKWPSNPQLFFTPWCLPPATPDTLSYRKPPTNVC